MAAGTAAALVPIRSITRRTNPAYPLSLQTTARDQPRLSVTASAETITYIPESEEDAGQICLKLLATLKGIQLGKIKDDFGWCFTVSEADGQKIQTNGTNDTSA
jgi:branched-chain amino acid aminotransferase